MQEFFYHRGAQSKKHRGAQYAHNNTKFQFDELH
jgi:hypothetical protein